MSTLIVDRVLVAIKNTLSTPIVEGKHSALQVFGSSESYRNVSSESC